MSKDGHIGAIDGLRAVAVVAVVFYHSGLFPFLAGGFTGVDVFFVVSGYVISRSLHGRSSSNFPRYLSEFYKRRVLRIVPALAVCLFATVVASVLFIPSLPMNGSINRTGLSAFFGYGNYALVWHNNGYFSPLVEFNTFLHTWSLGVEEQFYLIFPAIFYVWLRLKDRDGAIGSISRWLLIVLGVASFAFAIHQTTADHDRAFYLLPSRFWELASGAVLYQFHARGRLVSGSRWVSESLLGGGLLLACFGFVFANRWAFPIPWALLPVGATLLMLSGAVGAPDSRRSPVLGALRSSAATYVGKISYSLYLWHWPVAAMLRWTVGLRESWQILAYLAASFALAAASYHLVEKRVRYSKHLSRQGNLRIIVGGLAVLVVTFFASQAVVRSQPSISLSVTKDNYVWRSRPYARDEAAQPTRTDLDVSDRTLFVFGDSHAAAYRTMLHIVSSQLGFEVRECETGGCGVVDLKKPMSDYSGCSTYYERSLGEIRDLAEAGDMVFLASLRMPEISNRFELVDETSVVREFLGEEAAADRQRAIEEASRLIDELASLGVEVLIDAPMPVIRIPPYRCSDWFNRTNPICSPGLTIARGYLNEIRAPVMESLQVLMNRHKNLHVWDPLPSLCTEDECSAYDSNGLPIFYDGDHLSGNGNRLLVPSFTDALLAIWEQPSE